MCCASEKRVRLVLSPSHRAWKFKSLIRKMEPKWSPQSNLDDGLRYWLFYACNNRDFCLMESTLAALGGSESARVKGDSYLCAYLASAGLARSASLQPTALNLCAMSKVLQRVWSSSCLSVDLLSSAKPDSVPYKSAMRLDAMVSLLPCCPNDPPSNDEILRVCFLSPLTCTFQYPPDNAPQLAAHFLYQPRTACCGAVAPTVARTILPLELF